MYRIIDEVATTIDKETESFCEKRRPLHHAAEAYEESMKNETIDGKEVPLSRIVANYLDSKRCTFLNKYNISRMISTRETSSYLAFSSLSARECYIHPNPVAGLYNKSMTNYRKRSLIGHSSFIQKLGLRARLHFHRGCVNSLHIDEEADVMISGSDDTFIGVWRASSGTGLSSFETGHTHNIFGVKLQPFANGTKCASVAADGQVRYIDLQNQSTVKLDSHDEIALALAFIPQCTPAFISTFGQQMHGGEGVGDGVARVYDPRSPSTGEVFTKLPGFGLSDLCFSPREPNILAIGSDDCFVRCYDIRMNSSVSDKSTLNTSPNNYHGSSVKSSSFQKRTQRNRNERLPVSLYAPYEVLYDDVRQFIKKKYQEEDGNNVSGDTEGDRPTQDGVSGIDISNSGELLVTYRNAPAYRFEMISRDASPTTLNSSASSSVTSKRLSLTSPLPHNYHTDSLFCNAATRYTGHHNVLTFLKEIKYTFGETCVAMGSDTGHIHVWDKISGNPICKLKADTRVVNSIASHKSLPLLYTSGINKTIKMWSPRINHEGNIDLSNPKSVEDVWTDTPDRAVNETRMPIDASDEDEEFWTGLGDDSGITDEEYSWNSTDSSMSDEFVNREVEGAWVEGERVTYPVASGFSDHEEDDLSDYAYECNSDSIECPFLQ